MADALDSGSSGSLSCVGSSPILRTMKALEIQGLFRILGAKNIFHFYGCKISTSETRTSDLLPKMRANNW